MHLFKTRLLCLFRNKTLLFWTLIFPIALSTFFNLAFTNITSGEALDIIDIAIVDNGNIDDNLLSVMADVKYDNDEKMFNINKLSKDEAKTKLSEGEVVAILELNNEGKISLTFNNGGIYQTIIKSFLDEYIQTSSAVTEIMILSGGTKNVEEIISEISSNKTYLKAKDTSKNTNVVLIYFFSLIGMAIIYGGYWGTDTINKIQANLSSKGMRICVSPVNRLKLLIIHLCCAFIIHIVELLLLFAYLTFIGIDFGERLPLMLLTTILGSITGISFGAFTSIALKKANEGVKVLITTIVGILGGFLSGMMNTDIKYLVGTKVPFLNYINPVGVISDALYSLYYYPTLDRYFSNLIILSIMTLIFLVGTYLFFRRDKYESI